MLLRISVVLLALVALFPISGNAAEIMMNRNDCGADCRILGSPQQYTNVPDPDEDGSSTPKDMESETAMFERPVVEQDIKPQTEPPEREPPMLLVHMVDEGAKQNPQPTETERPMLLLQSVGEGTKHQPGTTEGEPNILVLKQVGDVTNHEPGPTEGGNNMEPSIMLLKPVGEGSSCERKNEISESATPEECANEGRNEGSEENAGETKKEETQPTMMFVRTVPNDNAGETKKEETQPTMMLVRTVSNDNAGETKKEETQPTMMLVRTVPNDNAGETKKEDTMMLVHAIPTESCCGKKLLSTQPALMILPHPKEERSNENAATEPMILIPTRVDHTQDEKENEIEEETLEKEEAKAEEEDSSMDVCRCSENELLQDNNHIKKDLNCHCFKKKNNSLGQGLEIGVIKNDNSLKLEDHHTPEVKKQNWKRAINIRQRLPTLEDKLLAMDYVTILDKAMGYPYTKNPDFEVDEPYNSPWRRYTLQSMEPSRLCQTYYS
ncbi:unnamed protein product [Nezara viridula]|uniref:Neuropeptide n=1 Tax=Nezara viridula TaxID=85310 RepID=A0A9P0HKZ7_NEZVI|nr:unnamed protein product [Nezara viridula]